MLQNKRKILIWLWVMSMVFILHGCNQEPGSVENKEPIIHILPVTEVVDEELPVYYRTIGSVISDNLIQITSRITGYIDEVPVRDDPAMN